MEVLIFEIGSPVVMPPPQLLCCFFVLTVSVFRALSGLSSYSPERAQNRRGLPVRLVPANVCDRAQINCYIIFQMPRRN